MTETRARRRIRKAVESRGYQLATLEWEPWGAGGEKSGITGGWYGTTDRKYAKNEFPGNEIMGLSVEETLEWIDEFVEPPEPCDCPTGIYPRPSQSLEPTWVHPPTCRWNIAYRLAWWTGA